MVSLHRFLIDYDMVMLRVLAQNRGLALATNRHTEAVDQLAVQLLDPLSVRTALAGLGDQAREALDALLAAGGRMRVPPFARRFGQVRPAGPGRLERESLWREPANAAEELWYAGLIYRAFVQDEKAGPGEFFFVPDDLKPLLPPPRGPAPAFAVQSVTAPAIPAGAETDLVQDLFAYLVYVQNHEVRPYADGRLGRRDRAALRERLGAAEQMVGGAADRRLALARHLAARLGLVSRPAETLRLEAAAVKGWLTAAPARQAAALQEAWRDDPTWNDLCRVPNLICDQAETPWRNDPLATRRALLALLARCPPGDWWSLSSFVAAVKEIHPDFQRPDGDYGSWYLRDADGEYLSGFESWDRVEGRLITDLLTGPLCWLGVVAADSASAAESGTLCRITEAGARFLGLVDGEPGRAPSPPIAVQPDFHITLSPPASLYTRFQLERFAEPLGAAVTDAGVTYRYRLTVGSLGRALARGIQGEQVLAFLGQASEDRVPANVAGQLRLWAGRFGQVELEEVALLRVKEERVLKELSVLPETRSLIARVLSPTTALVRKGDLARLRAELVKLGYLPPE